MLTSDECNMVYGVTNLMSEALRALERINDGRITRIAKQMEHLYHALDDIATGDDTAREDAEEAKR